MDQNFTVAPKILELNRSSGLIQELSARLKTNSDDNLVPLMLEQLLDAELLVEDLLPDPAAMAERMRELMAKSLQFQSSDDGSEPAIKDEAAPETNKSDETEE